MIAATRRPAASDAVLGVDIGTSSSKGVLVTLDGRLLAQASREHAVDRPCPGQVEMDATIWWREFAELARELSASADAGVSPLRRGRPGGSAPGTVRVRAVGVSGMGPCTLLADEAGHPLRPAILYGIDTRAGTQITRLTSRYGTGAIIARCGSALTSQAVGPKLAWLTEHEPTVFAAARRFFMPSSYLVWRLTGQYVLDHHSASQAAPLYDRDAGTWYAPWWAELAGSIEPPALSWPGEVAGQVTGSAAVETGLPAGIPVITGTIDAWAEAVSVDACHPGDLMLMYGTTMFLVATLHEPLAAPPLWGTVGIDPGSRCLAGGMATSGAITAWLRDLTGRDYAGLLAAAEASGPGARGLLMLPYFAGERTPIADPLARGVLAGLTVSHTAGDLYRAALEATAFGVRHNLAAFTAAGAVIGRVVAVGGGTQGGLWTQIVSDVTGQPQQLRRHSVGASLGSAFLAGRAVAEPSIQAWNPPTQIVEPRPELCAYYDRRYAMYRELYERTAQIAHALAVPDL